MKHGSVGLVGAGVALMAILGAGGAINAAQRAEVVGDGRPAFPSRLPTPSKSQQSDQHGSVLIPIYTYCDPQEMVRLVGVLVGADDGRYAASRACFSTDLVCDLQLKTYEAEAKFQLWFRLEQMHKVCKASGY